MVQYGEGEQKSLQSVCDIISKPQKWEQAIELMCQSVAWDGMLARMGGTLLHWKERELASTMSTMARFLRPFSTPAIAAATRSSTCDPVTALEKSTTYIVLPADRVGVLSPLLRLWIGTFIRVAQRSGSGTPLHLICDEAGSSLGKMDEIAKALLVGRSAGIRLQLYYQDMGELNALWPNGASQTLLANTNRVFFGVNDVETAKYVNQRLDKETIVVGSGGTTQTTSRQPSQQGGNTYSYSSTTSNNWQFQARELLQVGEVLALDERVAITFTPGAPPIWTRLLRYYENDFGQPTGPGPLKMALDAACLFLPAAMLAAWFTAALFYHMF